MTRRGVFDVLGVIAPTLGVVAVLGLGMGWLGGRLSDFSYQEFGL